MSIYTDIQNDLTSFVRSTLSTITIVGENERYKPVLDTTYAQCYLLPATTVRETLGEGGKMKYSGLFQVSIRVSSQSGSQVNTYVDKLVDAVNEAPLRDLGETALHLRQVTRLPGMVDGDWFVVPVRIEFWSYA